MTRSELINTIRDGSVTLTQQQAGQLVSLILGEIVRAVNAGERVEFRGFGSFFPRQRQSRMGRNPKTGEPVFVPARQVLFFKAGRDLLLQLNRKKAGKSHEW